MKRKIKIAKNVAKMPERRTKMRRKKKRKEVQTSGFADGKFSFSDGACVWCMWLSDSGSGFGKIVKCQTDLQKKCQKGLHNDTSCLKKPVFMRVSAISISLLITN